MSSRVSLSEFSMCFVEYFQRTEHMHSLSVSPVTIEGIEEIVQFYDEAFKSLRWFGTQMGSKTLENFFCESLLRQDMLWLKLVSGNDTVGFSALVEDGEFLYSDETLISTAFQGRGIGTIYFRVLCDVAKQLQKPIYGDIVYSKSSRVIARVFVDEFGLVPIGLVLTRTRQQLPLAMVRIATQQSLQDLSVYERTRSISDAIYRANSELRGGSKKCVGFNHDTNVPMLLDDPELIYCLLAQSDQTNVGPVACLLELVKLQIP